MPDKHPNRSRRRHALGRLLVLSVACVAFTGVRAEISAAADTTASPASPSRPAPTTDRTDGLVTIGGLLLVGVIGVGLALIALTILWGNRTRREAKKPLPRQTTRDELWFLRSRAESQDGADASDDNEENDEAE